MPSVMESRSYGSVKIFWLNREEALRRLQEAAGRLLGAHPDVLGVYLFGSLAEGRAIPGSDADLLILLVDSNRRWLDRPLEFHTYFDGVGLPVDIFCYTAEEATVNPIARRALEHGVRLA